MMPEIPSRYTGPGLVDLQMNGYCGFDFNSDPDSWKTEHFQCVADALRSRGVVAALPTIITDESELMKLRASKFNAILNSNPELESIFPGLHIEGPFISPEDGPRGAHPEVFCSTPDDLPCFLSDLQEASGNRIKMFTLAPEIEGVMEIISEAIGMDICVGIGHTSATPLLLDKAVSFGARLSTHLGNGSHQTLPRHSNYIQYQLSLDSLFASFIADGHHIPFYALKNYIRSKGVDRSVLVTDAISAADVGPGVYRLGNEEVFVRDDLHVSKPGEPNLAGSALTLDCAVLNIVSHCDVSFDSAWKMASEIPASLIGLTALPEVSVNISRDGFELIKPG
jgi:N-acetylglucosamine-6-phosphate deacetylase